MTTTGWFTQLTSLSLITRVWFYAFDATIPGYLVSRFEVWHTCYLTQKSSSPARRFVCSRRPWLQTTVTWRARDCSRAEDYWDVLFFISFINGTPGTYIQTEAYFVHPYPNYPHNNRCLITVNWNYCLQKWWWEVRFISANRFFWTVQLKEPVQR